MPGRASTPQLPFSDTSLQDAHAAGHWVPSSTAPHHAWLTITCERPCPWSPMAYCVWVQGPKAASCVRLHAEDTCWNAWLQTGAPCVS